MQVGLLIGKNWGSRPYILQLAPTPCQDGVQAVSCQQSRDKFSSSTLQIDRDWVIEHAAQVLDMLPGGLGVIGLYILCPATSLAASSGIVLSVLKGLQAELPGERLELVQLHIDSITARLVAKEYTGGLTGALKPCEIKPSNLLGSSLTVTCRLDVSLLVHLTNPNQRLFTSLSASAERFLQHRIQQAVPLLNGKLYREDATMMDLAPTSTGRGEGIFQGGTGAIISAELLKPPSHALQGEQQVKGDRGGMLQQGKGVKDVYGRLQLVGQLDCRAFLHRWDSASAAVDAIKQDASRTLRARIRMLAELAEQGGEDLTGEQAGAEHCQNHRNPIPELQLLQQVKNGAHLQLQLPRRVFAAGGKGAIMFSDHLFTEEDDRTVLCRCKDLLGLKQDELRVVESNELSAQQSFKQAQAVSSSVATSSSLQYMLMVTGAVTVFLLALVLGLLGLQQ